MSCTLCPLHAQCKNVRQMGNGNRKKARVMVIQESPYKTENTRKQYMGGRPGRMFRSALAEFGIPEEEVYFTSVVKCSTPEDRLPMPDEIAACKDYLWAEIDVVEPEIIIPTGNISLSVVAGLTGITKHRGKLTYTPEGVKVLPIIHPNLVLKQPKYMDNFMNDLATLDSILNGTAVTGRESMQKSRLYCDTFESAVNELMRIYKLPAGTEVTFDIESVKSNPFVDRVSASKTTMEKYPRSLAPKIVAIGFSDRAGYGNAIPLYHRENMMPDNQIGALVKLIRLIFARKDLIFVAHNGKFDLRYFKAWLGIDCATMDWDTMLMHYLAVTEEQGTHGLKDLAWLETDMGGYDDALDKYKPKGEDEGNFDLIPWDVLKVYLADDCDVTHRLLAKYKPLILNDPDRTWLWKSLMVPAQYALLDIELNGLYVDQDYLAKLSQTYPEEIRRIENRLLSFPEVLEMSREREAYWKERVYIASIPKRDRTDEQQDKFVKYKKYDPSKGGDKVNFGSSVFLKELLFERLGLKTDILTDKGEEARRNGETLTTAHYSTKDESLNVMNDQHPIVPILREMRKVNHLNNNFIVKTKERIDRNSIIHPTYNLHGTVTGRLSSTDPNAQQLPRKVYNPYLFQYWNEIKSLFVSRFEDGVIVQFDYSQLELRILAAMTGDPTLIQLYKDGADLHKEVASSAFGVPIEEVTKDQRTAAKKIQFGVVYQESAGGLSDDLRAEGIDMSKRDCEVFISKYFKRFPLVEKWIKSAKRYTKAHKKALSALGRVRNLQTIDSIDNGIASQAERQSVNFPIQSSGSDCTLMSIILINKEFKKRQLKSVICATVHDSIVFDCHPDEVVEVMEIAKEYMENLENYNPKYEFLKGIPLLSEAEIGFSYGASFECTIEDIKAQGAHAFIKDAIASSKKKTKEEIIKNIEKGTKTPVFVPAEAYR